MLILHIITGFLAFVLGGLAALWPKYGPLSKWHRWFGRAYAVVMLIMAGLSIPLAARQGSGRLLIIGILTLAVLVLGWLSIRALKSGTSQLNLSPKRHLINHVIFMGSSYIAAWTAFLLNNPILAMGYWWDDYVSAFGPTVIGSVMIAVVCRRIRLGKSRSKK